MSVESERLISLIDFAQQSARMRSHVVAAVNQHGVFALHEHELQGLPGISLNVDGDEEDEVWLIVERLRETRPPERRSAVLKPWVQLGQGPYKEPRLREDCTAAALIAAGTHYASTGLDEPGKMSVEPESTVRLADYGLGPRVRAEFEVYLERQWRPWADEEKIRLNTIKLYGKLFTLKQQLEGAIVEAQIELVWGVGLGVWQHESTNVSYPLITRPVEISVNAATAAVEIRPRDVDARLETDWYASVDNPGLAVVETAAQEFFARATSTFSPFDHGTFEPLLRVASTNLDVNGVYWPDHSESSGRLVPPADDKLKVTDTWVLFARPRTNSVFLQDLENLKQRAAKATEYPPAVTSVITEPETSNEVARLPAFRGVSATDPGDSSGTSALDLYFPKPFNDEQVRIVQLLDVADGVVVQGPPGTGKTHTIANVICHYLALGKRVLVTSMKEPALMVLQEQLPAEIRPLAISLLTSEQEGMKQFEHAIHKIASEVQALDRIGTERTIKHLEESIDALHGRVAAIDQKTAHWAKLNLRKLTLDGEQIEPQDAAHQVVESNSSYDWIPDLLDVGPEFTPQFSDADVIGAREARRVLGQDIDYLDASLPQLIEFPDARTLLQVHQDLAQFERLKRSIECGDVPALADSSQETLARAHQLVTSIAAFRTLRNELRSVPSFAAMHKAISDGEPRLTLLERLGRDLRATEERRTIFLQRPVVAAPRAELDQEFTGAVENLSNGKSAFGLKGLFGNSERKRQLASVTVLGVTPTTEADWSHVSEYLALNRELRGLATRWNTLARELTFEVMPAEEPEDGVSAIRAYGVFEQVNGLVAAERDLPNAASTVFPTWPHGAEVASKDDRLAELEQALRHHLAKERLARVWANRARCEQVLEGRSGRVVDALRAFFREILGNPDVTDAEFQSKWSDLTAGLARVHGLATPLLTVRAMCEKVRASSAPKYAELLQQPLTGSVDSLLPDDWRKDWRLRRLATYLDSIDGQHELKRLAREREEAASDLSRAYREVVVKRTWLQLATNASPSVRAALQAYLTAVQKIGKGTGKRAVRYRQDARMAAAKANPAVPCWIMAHHRVSETLPPELGCFHLVVIDEASQSDLAALPSLLRAQKILVVGDDKQVSPEGIGLEEEKVRSLMARFLRGQVDTYRPQMSPERSMYDLFKVVFAKSSVMLKEHFRSVAPIIEYSKREFYNHELRPLRVPKTSERLDPPLIDVLVQDGYRNGDTNQAEVRVIVREIKRILSDPAMKGRSIGVVSLLGYKQALEVWSRLTEEVGPEAMERCRLACGDARTFQGKERDIMFLSLVSAPNDKGQALSRDTFAQRFNVAASRARDRMYLVRSMGLEHLSPADTLRRGLISHFASPFANDECRVQDLRALCESPFEREMYDELTQRGYWVTPQVQVGHYRVDFIVEGHNDTRLVVECDGDRYHGVDKWAEDMQRQRVLERAGLVFWRCFASTFIRRRQEVLEDLVKTLNDRDIAPIGSDGAPKSVHVEQRVVVSTDEELSGDRAAEVVDGANSGDQESPSSGKETVSSSGILRSAHGAGQHEDAPDAAGINVGPLAQYVEYAGEPCEDPRTVPLPKVVDGIVRIAEAEGPIVAKRLYDVYLRSCGIKRLGPDLHKTMNRALYAAIRAGHVVAEDEAGKGGLFFSVVRVPGSEPIRVRRRGPREVDEIPPSEIQLLAHYLAARDGSQVASEGNLRAVLECHGLKRLTTQMESTLTDWISRKLPQVHEALSRYKDV